MNHAYNRPQNINQVNQHTFLPLFSHVLHGVRSASDGALEALREREVLLSGQAHRRDEEAERALQRVERVVPVFRCASGDVLELHLEPEQNAGGEKGAEGERAAVLAEERVVGLWSEELVE